LIKESAWNKYRIPLTLKGVDYIMKHILVEDSDFIDLAALTKRIEKGTLEFINDIESFLSKN
jgi:hypothetical protein